ncbi:FtsX-like permease family protein [Kitasatospora sp. NBC_01539]|uniref:FtsX-like permease family protein n=1 Tax=Kitasatospora sp. NBC_01539 TaxID=2903577 RepID=UPI0038602D51
MKLTAWRAALRIARRDALRAKGRSALVLAMIALPVLGVAGADIVYRSADLDPVERITRQMGRADALVDIGSAGQALLQAPDPREGAGSFADGNGKQRARTPQEQHAEQTPPEKLTAELLPPGSTLVALRSGPSVQAATKEGLLRTDTAEADLADPVWHGKLNLLHGRAPAAADEVAATRAFLDQSGLREGDTTTLKGLEGRTLTVTAVVEYPDSLDGAVLVGRPGALVKALDPAGERSAGPSWLVRLPAGAALDWPAVQKFNAYGLTVASRSVILDPPPRSRVPYYTEMDRYGAGGPDPVAFVVLGTVAGMALLEIVLLAGPAFAVGARRSRRQLGLLAAGGGDRSHIRAVVLGGGVVLGIAGAVVGVVLATATVAVLRPWAEEQAGSRFGHLDLQPLDLLGVAAIGLVTGLLAAVVPAVQAARQDVVEALTGRGSVKPASRRLAVLGLLMVVGGSAVALFGTATDTSVRTLGLFGGSAIAELGMVCCAPMLIGLFGRLGRHLPLSPRLALRDAVRHRGRTAPAVAAVMAAVAGAVAVGIYTASADEQNRREYQAMLPAGAVMVHVYPDGPADRVALDPLRAAVERAAPALGAHADFYGTTYSAGCGASSGCGGVNVEVPEENRCPEPDPAAGPAAETERQRDDARCRDSFNYGMFGDGTIAAGDGRLLHAMFRADDPAGAQALAAGKAVVFDPRYLGKDGRITVDLTQWPADGTTADGRPAEPKITRVTVDAVVVAAEAASSQAVVSPETARRLGLTVELSGSVWLPDTVPSSAAEQRATAAVGKVDDRADLRIERGYQSEQTLVGLALTGFAALVALGAAGIATGLAAADSQRDLATLAAVGATGGIRRRLSGFQCGVIAAMGTVLGAVCGVVPAVALRKLEVSGMSAAMGRSSEAVIVFPWRDLAVTFVGLPLLAVGLAMLFTRSRLELGRRAA